MAKKIGEETQVTLDLKTISMIIGFIIMIAGMWFTLQADIAQAKELPKPVIDRIEYDSKRRVDTPNNYGYSRRC